jgi:hypothetical protein
LTVASTAANARLPAIVVRRASVLTGQSISLHASLLHEAHEPTEYSAFETACIGWVGGLVRARCVYVFVCVCVCVCVYMGVGVCLCECVGFLGVVSSRVVMFG